MFDAALSLTLPQDQIVAVNLNLRDPKAAHLLERIALAQGEGQRRAEIENRTYHMGAKPTPGLDYDDRLTVRLKCCATVAYGYLDTPEKRGGLRHTRLGKKYHVTERAVRDFEGDKPQKQTA
jgi:hypothetical protein